MNDITMAFIVAVAVAFALYMQIQKMTKNIDQKEAMGEDVRDHQKQRSQINTKPALESSVSEEKVKQYKKFCDDIDVQIRELKQKALYDDMLKNSDDKDEFLAELSQISRQITFIQNMNSKKGKTEWESELFDVLERIENVVNKHLKNADAITDEVREALKESFAKLSE